MQYARSAKNSCELCAKIEINVLYVKCLPGDTYNGHLKVELWAVSTGVLEMSCHRIEQKSLLRGHAALVKGLVGKPCLLLASRLVFCRVATHILQ